MRIKFFLVVFLGVLVLPVGALAATTYSYIGNNFTFASGAYATSDSVTGEFTVSVALAPNLVDEPIAGLATDWSFTDGVQTLDSGNSVLGIPSNLARVTTDAGGNIVAWLLFVVDDPIATAAGQTNNAIVTVTSNDSGYLNLTCDFTTDGFCSSYTSGAERGFTGVPGAWDMETVPEPGPVATQVPTMSAYGLVLTMLGLILVATRRLRVSTKRS